MNIVLFVLVLLMIRKEEIIFAVINATFVREGMRIIV